ncbi:MAG TPA: ATP synthase F1 subunit epsilon [Erysipelotrichaceae bacterium]|jgi:F-type H+-transporting ATPase subunit epsilon|nr:ATP synthase F1 subunit epsilon [Erysipelotrichia bacterium]HPX32256.1 ATP synthase F1 subunit epsilon [Erysipelotrichaceae bacterium]HQA84767.1 ATP synthase F1 subunit epsilon [Erysipelotrichaceae bacterium]
MNNFKVHFVTYKGLYETVETNRLNVPTAEGRRCILANHMPIMLPLKIGVIETTFDKIDSYHSISDGMLLFENNEATILCDAIENVQKLDKRKVRASIQKAEEKLSVAQRDTDIILARASLAKAMNRLEAINKYLDK